MSAAVMQLENAEYQRRTRWTVSVSAGKSDRHTRSPRGVEVSIFEMLGKIGMVTEKRKINR